MRDDGLSNRFVDRQFGGEQIEDLIGNDGKAAQPTHELSDHHASGDDRRMNRGPSRAGADVAIARVEQRGRIVFIRGRPIRYQHAAEPNKGYDAKAAERKAKLEAMKP